MVNGGAVVAGGVQMQWEGRSMEFAYCLLCVGLALARVVVIQKQKKQRAATRE